MSNETLFPIQFSSSMFSDIWKCEMYFFRKHCQRLVGGNRSHHLIAGGHIARACELTRKAYFNEGKDEEEAIDIGINHILESEDTGDELKSNERVAMCFKKYFKKYKLSSNLKPVPLADGTFAIEYLFRFDLGIPHPEIPGQNIVFKGKLDGLYERPYQQNRKVSVLDEKSTARVPKNSDGSPDIIAEENVFNSRGQFLAYHFAARELGVETHETIVRRFPITKEYQEPYELILPINNFMLNNWKASTVAKIEELIEKYKWLKSNGGLPQRAFYPIYSEGCNEFNRPCEFKIGCLNKEGESEIFSSYKQAIFTDANNNEAYSDESVKEWALKEYKQFVLGY